MSDVYNEAVKYLNENPDKIWYAWNDVENKGGILFQYANQDGFSSDGCGCLTTIVHSWRNAATKELTEMIRSEEQFNIDMTSFRYRDNIDTVAVAKRLLPLLDLFAEWQRKIDKILNRKMPASVGN